MTTVIGVRFFVNPTSEILEITSQKLWVKNVFRPKPKCTDLLLGLWEMKKLIIFVSLSFSRFHKFTSHRQSVNSKCREKAEMLGVNSKKQVMRKSFFTEVAWLSQFLEIRPQHRRVKKSILNFFSRTHLDSNEWKETISFFYKREQKCTKSSNTSKWEKTQLPWEFERNSDIFLNNLLL